MRRLLAILLLIPLAGCWGSDAGRTLVTPPPKPKIAAPSPTAMAACEDPVQLRKGPATQQQVEIAWGVDDDHLVDCAARHRILANYIRKRDAGLTGSK